MFRGVEIFFYAFFFFRVISDILPVFSDSYIACN